MKVGVNEILNIPKGAKQTFKVDKPKDFMCVRSAASYAHLTNPELGVKFKTSINRSAMEITVISIPIISK